MIDLSHAAGPALAAFLASTVEFVEALTVVLAVGGVRGWRDTLFGAAAAVGLLAVLTAVLGPALTLVPLRALQVAVGVLLLLFGLRWLRKAILRAAGVLALHDETAAYAKERDAMLKLGGRGAGGAGLLLPASVGAALAFLLVTAIGFAVHRPLARVPENTLKFIVGVILSSFGAFWLGEGIGVAWPAQDLSIPAMIVGFGLISLAAVPICRARGVRAAEARA